MLKLWWGTPEGDMLSLGWQVRPPTFLTAHSTGVDRIFTLVQGWTILNKNLSRSWSFLAPIILPELELGLLGCNISYQSWSWSFWALKFFLELELDYKLQPFLLELELELIVLDKNVGSKSGATKVMFQINLETHLKLNFSNIFLFIITSSILLFNNTRHLPLRKGFQNPHLAFYLKQMGKLNWKSEVKPGVF